jgi:uncharacterized protein
MTGSTRRAALAATAGLLAAPRGGRAQATQLAIATGTVGGVYYPLGGGLANILSRNIPGLSATVEVTGGAVANLQLLGANRVGLILTQVDSAMDALRGEDRFRGRPVPVRAIAVIYTNRMQVVTTAASGIQRFGDLKGKRISTGAPGSWTEVVAFRMLEAAGLDKDRDFRARERLSPNESTNAIKDGKLDAYFFTGGLPTGAITDLAASPGIEIRLIDHDELVPKLVEKYGPVYVADVIPAGSYPGQRSDNRQLSIVNLLAVREEMPADLVTSLLDAAWRHREDLGRVHPEGRNFTLERQRNAIAGIPWHPAAATFWQAQGAVLG